MNKDLFIKTGEKMFSKDSYIIVIDDSIAVRILVKEQLIQLGYKNIIDAENGKEAIKKIESMHKLGIKMHVIIADWNMPEMNGIELLGFIKKDPRFRDIPFLMITSESDTENVIKAIVLGVSDYIVKPFDETILEEKLSAIWKRIGQKG